MMMFYFAFGFWWMSELMSDCDANYGTLIGCLVACFIGCLEVYKVYKVYKVVIWVVKVSVRAV